MRAPTHLAFAGMCGVIAAGMGSELSTAAMASLAVGAVLPDIDISTSGVGRWLKPISQPIERRFGHRTLTHSLLGVAITAIISAWLLMFSVQAWVWLLIGMMTHILLDTHNIQGVRLLYPLRLEFVSVTNKSWRCGYGTAAEFGYLAFFSVAALAMMPLALDGFSPWFHRMLGAPYGAVEDYLLWRSSNEVHLDIKGVNLIDNEDINGRYLVIDVLGAETLLVEDGTGRAFTVAQRSANIQATRVAAWKGDELSASTYRLELAGRRISDLLVGLPRAKRVLVTGELDVNYPSEPAPAVGHFERVRASGSTLKLRAARVSDLEPYANLLVKQGTVVIRAFYELGAEHVALTLEQPPLRSHVLSVQLPTVSGLLLNVGDEVIEGERIARKVDDDALEQVNSERLEALEQLPELTAQLAREQESYHALRREGERAVTAASDEVAKQRYLVSKDASPRNVLATAERELSTREAELLQLDTDWTSRKTILERQIRQHNLAIAKAEREATTALEQQWVTSPLSGLVSEIRVTQATTAGVMLDIIILEGGAKAAVNHSL